MDDKEARKLLEILKNPKLFVTAGMNNEEVAIEYASEITLLDLFAGMALQGMLANDSDRIDEATAKEAYEIAQAMLYEREKNLQGESDA